MKSFAVIIMLTLTAPLSLHAQNMEADVAAKKFFASLNNDQQKSSVFPLADTNLFFWHYVPLKNRVGISLNEMNGGQKKLSLELLQSVLGKKAYSQSLEIMNLENYLKKIETNREAWVRDAGNYRFVFFGDPIKDNVYLWRFEGHHLSFTFSSIRRTLVSTTPAFMGTNPAIVPDGPDKGKEILKDESLLGFSFLHTLRPHQLAKAVVSKEVPDDVVTGNRRKVLKEQPQGIRFAELDKSQKMLLVELVHFYVHRNTRLFANKIIKEIKKDGLQNLYFLWIGAQKKEIGKPHYYRIQGPGFIIEFDNSQNNANHVHTVFRDLKRDFGGDELEVHYKKSHL